MVRMIPFVEADVAGEVVSGQRSVDREKRVIIFFAEA